MLLIAVFLAWLAWHPQGEKEAVSVSLLLKYAEDSAAEQKDEILCTAFREGWIQCQVQLSEQFYQIDAVNLNFTEDERHEIFVTGVSGEILDLVEARSGQYTIDVPRKAEAVVFSIKEDEADSLQPKGILVAGEAERKEKNSTAFSGKKLSVLGDSLSALTGYVSSGYWSAYPAEGVSTEDIWWYSAARELDMEICMVNACGGSGVTMASWANEQGLVPESGRGRELDAWGEEPDIIIVLLGANDAIVGADGQQIRQGFAEILEEALEAYPDSELYLCEYYVFNIEYKEAIAELNGIITEMGQKYGVSVLDLQTCGITAENCQRYRIDEVHPNREGQQMIAGELVRQLSSSGGV